MSTKELILNVSLELFAKKGYDGVSVREIARQVGVRESALYKHYKNKEDILITIAEVMKERLHETYVRFQVPETVSSDVAGNYGAMSIDAICELSWNLFMFFTKDPMNSNFRKLLTREQYNNPIFADYYEAFFLSGVIDSQGRTFKKLVESGMFKRVDERIIALQFFGPILLLFQQYDCHPEKEDEIKELLFSHVRTFGENYEYR